MFILQNTPPYVAEMVVSCCSWNRYTTDTDVLCVFTKLKSVSKFWKPSLILESINTGVTFQEQSTAKHLVRHSAFFYHIPF